MGLGKNLKNNFKIHLRSVENYGSILRTIEIKEENDRGTIIEYFKIYDNR